MGNIISDHSPRLSLGGKKRRKVQPHRQPSTISATSTATASSSDSTSSFRYIDGRRFNENTKYTLPNDDEEIDRLHMQHYLQRYIWQGNFCAPVHNILRTPGARVLDVGCGPGTWILEMAFDYPDTHFTGIDISPMYPKEIKPNNVVFEEADINQGLPFADNTFDFVVMRNMVNALSDDDWQKALKELERVCKPGGFVECLEFEIPGVRLGHTTKRMVEAYIQIMRTKNIDVTIAPRLEEMLTTSTSLMNLKHHVKMVPFGKWGDKAGKIMADDLLLIVKAIAPILIPLWGVGASQYQEFTNGLARELDMGRAYCNIHTIFAQKYDTYHYI
ncbi:158_t:CDS:2 [Funneliformis mosseae]|uniref:158_t:CDS:1 n=1 Tax=Funneliformis mosseae TaxID=27381 RepID=A0A9N9B616_FUNMO|nr:158_t:CDS:2 [Funneliformis mosseae]